MPKFTVEPPFWTLFPEASIGVLICTGLDNTGGAAFAPLLAQAQADALKHLPAAEFSQNAVIQTWRGAYSRFKTKKGARSSVEALLKRAQNAAQSGATGGSGLGSIHPLVDLYNSVSLRYAVPCGGEDLGAIQGDIRLTFADGTEDFVTLGSDHSEPPLPGELVYKDDAGAICRCLNWREASRTMLMPETTQAFMCIENIDPAKRPDFEAALDDLQALISQHLGASCTRFVLDRDHPQISWDQISWDS